MRPCGPCRSRLYSKDPASPDRLASLPAGSYHFGIHALVAAHMPRACGFRLYVIGPRDIEPEVMSAGLQSTFEVYPPARVRVLNRMAVTLQRWHVAVTLQLRHCHGAWSSLERRVSVECALSVRWVTVTLACRPGGCAAYRKAERLVETLCLWAAMLRAGS